MRLILVSSLLAIVAARASEPAYPDLPEPITSFGAAVLDGSLYVLGGHAGEAHHYSVETTLADFQRLTPGSDVRWEKLPKSVRSQGASLVVHEGFLYRVGGLAPMNQEGEKDALYSLGDFARFDPAKGDWDQLPDMPDARSSHDTVVVGDTLYVLGGWRMAGERKGKEWFDTMFVVDLSAEKISWNEVPQPFRRRAIAVAALNGRIYAMGGMDSEGDTSKTVDVFDTATRAWSFGPELPRGSMNGFGAAACVADGRLLVSTYAAGISALSPDGESWEPVAELSERRFFHRMLPVRNDAVVVIGGASRSSGHMGSLETILVR